MSQPIEGVLEVTVTLKIKNRVRSLILRFEGVDKKWICTELDLIQDSPWHLLYFLPEPHGQGAFLEVPPAALVSISAAEY